jgi:hypothetical protein
MVTNYPKLFFEQESKLIHKVGYSVALAMMTIGLAETIHSIPYIIEKKSDAVGMALGPAGIAAGSLVAYLYLREANVVY